MAALRSRDHTGSGQVVDLAIIEPILMMLGAPLTAYDQLGYVQPRTGNRSVNNRPRNVYRTADGDWLAVSTSSQRIAERVLRIVGRAVTWSKKPGSRRPMERWLGPRRL